MIMVYRAIFVFTIISMGVYFSYYSHKPPSPVDARYQKLNSQGQPMGHWQGPWACVYDQKTGLTWENKTDDEGIHDGYWTYSWYTDGKGKQNAGDCYFKVDRCDTSDLIERANLEKTCAKNNWRLPTAKELTSLISDTPKTGEAKISGDFFTFTKRGDYWTADADVPLTGIFDYLGTGAVAIDFIEGKAVSLPYRNAAFVRLVAE